VSIPDVGTMYCVGYFNIYTLDLDDDGDDFIGRINSITPEMGVFFDQEGVISWLKNNKVENVKFFCEFCNVFWNQKEECEDCEYVCIFDYSKILDHLYPKEEKMETLEQFKDSLKTKKSTTPFYIQHIFNLGGEDDFTSEYIITPIGEGKTDEEIKTDYRTWIKRAQEVDRDSEDFIEDTYAALWCDLGYNVEGLNFRFSDKISSKGIN
jgi:hypothetical protein